MKNGNELRILLDTGSNKNYIIPKYIRNPIHNKSFFANSVGGRIQITHHADVEFFGEKIGKLRFYILPEIISFDAIIGNDSLKNLDAEIHLKDNYFIL